MPSAPLSNEIEISIFGNSYGECIVVHLCDGEWIIVDSFRDPYTKRPIALEYLKSIKVDCAKNVKAIVATHWHDDHVCGLSDVINECKNALFICSEAAGKNEFLELVGSDVDLNESRPGIQELSNILETLKTRKATFMRAVENKILLNTDRYQVYSLSPSDHAISLAHREILALLPADKQPRKPIAHMDPNHTGIVVLISVSGQNILLGADLAESGDIRIGWSRIVADPARPKCKSTIFKIPHHGSGGAHNDNVWTQLLEPKPLSILSSFVRGSCCLPKKDDMRRILKYTNKVWITADPYKKRKPNKRDNMVEKTIKETVVSMRALTEKGHVKMRLDCGKRGASWTVELSGLAMPLDKCLVTK